MNSDPAPTFSQLAELAQAGWSVQIVPIQSPFGAVRAAVRWTRKRSPIDQEIDGESAAVPLVNFVALNPFEFPQQFANVVATMHARVFPISKDGLDEMDRAA